MNKKDENKERSFKRKLGHWISRADSIDKSLKPAVRKRKWMLILSALFVLFAASFLWDPMTELSSNNLDVPNKPENLDNKTITPTFEMPVDSFELHLKRNIHENISEKE
ncbi:hypothetical protein [Ancylomarina longa]|uniref:Uncharacterized protein n=1 Tax=Ancylomarina longa TaxID=2487017 RepID=A0A434AWP7_9BACT|nr:hypothetical protein [Ancylomarina longa]RUT78960.1 hypothetical protein DLK05_05615 [Ancylomarina longa]